jgi:hypothetical protein
MSVPISSISPASCQFTCYGEPFQPLPASDLQSPFDVKGNANSGKFILIDEDPSIYDDNYELLEQDRKDIVFHFVEKRILPSQNEVINWSYLQTKYSFRLCELTDFKEGLDCANNCDESEVESEDDETALFMGMDSVDSQLDARVLSDPLAPSHC